jgi:hypothetical protein
MIQAELRHLREPLYRLFQQGLGFDEFELEAQHRRSAAPTIRLRRKRMPQPAIAVLRFVPAVLTEVSVAARPRGI